VTGSLKQEEHVMITIRLLKTQISLRMIASILQCRGQGGALLMSRPFRRSIPHSRHPHDPAGRDGPGRAEIPAPETGNTQVLPEWFGHMSGHPEYPHGAEINTDATPVAEDAVYVDLHQDCRGGTYFQRNPPRQLSPCRVIYHSMPGFLFPTAGGYPNGYHPLLS